MFTQQELHSYMFRHRIAVYSVILFLFAGLGIAVGASIAPSNMVPDTIVIIKKDTGLSQTATLLKEKHVIVSEIAYKVTMVLMGGHGQIKAGEYLFSVPQSVITVASRTIHGVQGLPKIRVTIPEGLTARSIGTLIGKAIPRFDVQSFSTLARAHEGYLFPNTYFFYPNATPQDALSTMTSQFKSKTDSLQSKVQVSGHSFKDMIILASIVEKEATSTADRKLIAGILWNRISQKYPLQVDPPFFYILGKDSHELTLDDLKTDSPYNLYTHTGLPPTPISNPSFDAILAVLEPTPSKYWFYLSDVKGSMHYAVTYDGHLVNKAKYIK